MAAKRAWLGSITMFCILTIGFSLIKGVEGIYESIDDITNNLASDLAPLITLFGEQATKQFLSESTTFMDSIIFSMAPLGLITAVVSVIRIYGSSAQKSIIGRSQEAHGIAEAELCSSTSQDVCELWSNGGICRVFGRPKILDFIYDNVTTRYFHPRYREDNISKAIVEESPSCGILGPRDLFSKSEKSPKSRSTWHMSRLWEVVSFKRNRIPKGSLSDGTSASETGWEEICSAPWKSLSTPPVVVADSAEPPDKTLDDKSFLSPILTLNIGIRKVSKTRRWAILVSGVLIQLGFFGFATWATFYDPAFMVPRAPSSETKVWFGLTISGTILLVIGMVLCARMIDVKSRERRFKKCEGEASVFWLQPGGQRVGDQLFHAFAHSERRNDYITSRRLDDVRQGYMPLLAVASTTSGWVLQFVGLRGSPGSIALYQFIATLVMSCLRAVLRMKRLDPNKNHFQEDDFKWSYLIEGHELDWQAMHIDRDDQLCVTKWFFVGDLTVEESDFTNKEMYPEVGLEPSKDSGIDEDLFAKSTKHLIAYYTGEKTVAAHAANQASYWIAEHEAYFSNPGATSAPRPTSNVPTLQLPTVTRIPNPGAKIMRFRTRLAALTTFQPGLGISQEQAWDSEVRTMALQLKEALQVSAESIFAKFPLKSDWKKDSAPKSIAWKSSCWFSNIPKPSKKPQGPRPQRVEGHFPVGFQMYNNDGKWSINHHQLEAVLGLWLWSIKMVLSDTRTAEEQLVWSKMVVVKKSRKDDIKPALFLWVTQTRQVREYEAKTGMSESDNLSIPISILLRNLESNTAAHQNPGLLKRPSTHDTNDLTILGVPANESTTILQLMAQDIYTVFINRIVDIIGNLRDSGDHSDNLTVQDHPLATGPRAVPVLGLVNPHIDLIANALTSAGIATREEALMSIVPAFLMKMKLQVLDDDVVQNLLHRAKALRRISKFQEGADVLTWLLTRCPRRSQMLVLRCLGDLYRRAAQATKRSDREFGLSAMRDLKRCHSEIAADRQNLEILNSYEHVYEFFRNNIRHWRKNYENENVIREFHHSQRNRLEDLLTFSESCDLGGRWVAEACKHSIDIKWYILEFLELAIKDNIPELIEDFWKTPLVSSMDPEGGFVRLLSIALEHNCELETFNALIDCPDIDIDCVGRGLYATASPLVCAIQAGRDDVVRSILRKRPNLHQLDEFGETALHHAVRKGSQSITALLVEKDANIDVQNRAGETSVHIAVERDDEVMLELLLEKGGDIGLQDERGTTLLHRAAENRNGVVLGMLLEKRMDTSKPDRMGRIALHCAALSGNEANVQILLEKGSEISKRDENGQTALHLAAGADRKDVVRALLDAGADVCVEDEARDTALEIAIRKGLEGISRLLFRSLDQDRSVDYRRWSRLWSCFDRDNEVMVSLLQEMNVQEEPCSEEEDGADVEEKDREGSSSAAV